MVKQHGPERNGENYPPRSPWARTTGQTLLRTTFRTAENTAPTLQFRKAVR